MPEHKKMKKITPGYFIIKFHKPLIKKKSEKQLKKKDMVYIERNKDALGQKGRMRFFLNIFRKKRIRPFWPTKQPGKANQRYKAVSLPIGQKGHAE